MKEEMGELYTEGIASHDDPQAIMTWERLAARWTLRGGGEDLA
jgi:hypothetical protein